MATTVAVLIFCLLACCIWLVWALLAMRRANAGAEAAKAELLLQGQAAAGERERLRAEAVMAERALQKAEEMLARERAAHEELRVLGNEQYARLCIAEQQLTDRAAEHAREKEQYTRLYDEVQRNLKLMAAEALERNTRMLADSNKRELGVVLEPLRENLKSFEKKVQDVYEGDMRERSSLRGSIEEILKQSRLLGEEANNLTRALKGDTKKQGNWGEIILERVLEQSGLRKDTEYVLQQSVSTDGVRVQPDVVIHLPDNKHLVIDSKVSLVAYEQALAQEDEAARQASLKEHINSIKRHVQGLAAKEYHAKYGINSPDFVLLFMPIEASFSAAVQFNADLFGYAWERRVVIVSPTTLLATLRTIASIWRYDRQGKNVLEIAERGGKLYDKFCGVLADMDGLGRALQQAGDVYGRAMGKLSTGAGSISTQMEQLKQLGAKANKQIEQKHFPGDV